MFIFTRGDVTTAPSIEQFAKVSGRDRDRARERDFVGGCDSFGGDRDSYDGEHTVGDKGTRQCKHHERNNHISEKCWEKLVTLNGLN